MTDVAERRKRQDKAGGWGETIRTVVYAVLIALVVRTFAIEPFNIPSGSMIPTLLVGDYLFVSKYSYGYSKHSFPFSMGLFSGRIFGQPPERGDVAVFKYPGDQGQGINRTDYIKRIVGLPGDRIHADSAVPPRREQVRRGIQDRAALRRLGFFGQGHELCMPRIGRPRKTRLNRPVQA